MGAKLPYLTKRQRILLMLILLLAAVFRFGYMAKTVDRPVWSDEVSYDGIAWNLVTGNGYAMEPEGSPGELCLTARRGPAYVLFVAGIYSVFGHDTLPVKVAQVLLDLLTCYLLFLAFRLITRRVDAALIGIAFYAVHPPVIRLTSNILTETFVSLALIGSIYCFLLHVLRGKRYAVLVGALLAGIAALSKPAVAPLPILYLAAGACAVGWKQAAKFVVVQCAIVGLVMLPWIIRNYNVFHEFVPTVTQGGVTFWGGTGPGVHGEVCGSVRDKYVPKHIAPLVEPMPELERDRWLYREGVRIVKRDPVRFVAIMPMKISRLWFNLPFYKPVTKANILFSAGNVLVALLAIWGIIYFRLPKPATRLLAWLVVYWTFIHALYITTFRYSIPVYAYMFGFAGAGIVAIVERFRKQGTPSATAHPSRVL